PRTRATWQRPRTWLEIWSSWCFLMCEQPPIVPFTAGIFRSLSHPASKGPGHPAQGVSRCPTPPHSPTPRLPRGQGVVHMTTRFKIGDHGRWNSEAGHVSGKIVKVHTKNIDHKGYTHHATVDDPQYEISSD